MLINVIDIGGAGALSEALAESVVVSVHLELLDPLLLLLLCSCFVLVTVLVDELGDTQTLCKIKYICLVNLGSLVIGTDFLLCSVLTELRTPRFPCFRLHTPLSCTPDSELQLSRTPELRNSRVCFLMIAPSFRHHAL